MILLPPERKIILPFRQRANIGIEGSFILRKLDARRRVIYESPDWIPNLMTNNGMDRIGAALAFGSYLRIGTGTTAPTFADTGLAAQAASTSNIVNTTSVNNGAPNYETEVTSTFEFAQGSVVGNMGELGLAWSPSTINQLATHALIVDGGGSPTTISVLSGEILQVVYRIRTYPILTDATGTVMISGVSYNFVARSCAVGGALAVQPTYAWLGSVFSLTVYDGAIGTVTGSPTAATASASIGGGTFNTYTNGNYYIDFNVSAPISQGNLGANGIKSMKTQVGSAGVVFSSQISFDKTSGGGGIPKDNTKTFGMVLRVSWARH